METTGIGGLRSQTGNVLVILFYRVLSTDY